MASLGGHGDSINSDRVYINSGPFSAECPPHLLVILQVSLTNPCVPLREFDGRKRSAPDEIIDKGLGHRQSANDLSDTQQTVGR